MPWRQKAMVTGASPGCARQSRSWAVTFPYGLPQAREPRFERPCRSWDGKQSRDVTDFVWCLENRVNEDVHESAFPDGPSAPGRVSESASEPDDWDADDIRSTWQKNVG